MTSISSAWLQAIDRATDCLRHVDADSNGRTNRAGEVPSPSHDSVASSIAYLSQLEAWILAISHDQWDFPPTCKPADIAGTAIPDWMPTQAAPMPATRKSRRNVGTNNPYACIASTDASDYETSDDEEEEDVEAGDQVLMQPKSQGLSLLRLCIRIRTTISDLLAHQSKSQADAHEWNDACISLVSAIAKSRDAMHLADSEISRYFQFEHVGYSSSVQYLRDALEQDAMIVHVAIQSVVRRNDRFTELAQREMNKLERILQPQWESRDEVKSRIGCDRWTNNPRPKNNYAAIRKENEQELRQLQKAMESLEEADVDALATSALAMTNRLSEGTGHRYNAQRPEEIMQYGNTGRLGGYPDATEYQWFFTGSNPASRVEFFEKTFDDCNLVKLDWYYTTATVKTSMEHPRQGKTQMFAKEGVTPDLYVQILKNPRVHTDQRYQRKTPSNGRGRRRGRGSHR